MDGRKIARMDPHWLTPAALARCCLMVAVAAWCSRPVAPAGAADTHNMKVTVAGIQVGGHVSGPQLTDQSLAHRVVVLEFWGVNCPPCIASMPKLEELHRQYGPSGLVIVGAHAQGGAAAEVKKVVDGLGVTFSIVDSAQVADGMDFDGIPHCMVFDHTGQCIFRGSPRESHDAIVAAVRLAPSAVLEGRKLVKLAAFNNMLQDELSFGGAMRKAKGLTASKDEETAEEARFVFEKLEARGRRMLDEAVAAKETDPLLAAGLLQRCSSGFKGGDIGVEAAKVIREWKKDRSFMAAIKAAQQGAGREAAGNADAASTP